MSLFNELLGEADETSVPPIRQLKIPDKKIVLWFESDVKHQSIVKQHGRSPEKLLNCKRSV